VTALQVCLVTFASLIPSLAYAYDLDTHAKLSAAAAAESSVANALTSLQLMIYSKMDVQSISRSVINNGTAFGWIMEGAVREDGESPCDDRVRQHFYNPLNNMGYSFGALTGIPSPLWGLEDTTTASIQEFSYRDARGYFWSALQSQTDADHQRNLALMFRSLGQVIHLIQDAAQPQHTRNDSHAGLTCPYTFGLLGPASLYEEYVEGKAITGNLSYGGYPIVDLPRPRDFWDTEDGRGIAEFSNRNFVSAGTNFTGWPNDVQPASGFPSPNAAGARLFKEDVQTLIPGTSLTGVMTFVGTPWSDSYTGTGGYNTRTSTYSLFTDDLGRRGSKIEYSLNSFNYENAQQILIPRAVGYSAGLLNYFFRGTLEIAAPDRYAYLVAPYSNGHGTFTKLMLKLRNTTFGAETGSGTVQAIVRYRTASASSPLVYPYYAILRAPSYAISPSQSVSVTRDFQPLTFDFSVSPIPVDVADVSVMVVYRGPLTSPQNTESDAIVFGGKDVYEPQLINFGNSTDYDCYQDALYYVVDRPSAQRDLNQDGRQDLFGPTQEIGAYVRLQPYGSSGGALTAQTANYVLPGLFWAQYGSFVSVQDQSSYRFEYTSPNTVDTSTGSHSAFFTAVSLPRNINRIVDEDGRTVHEVSAYSGASYRGTFAPIHVNMVNGNIFRSQPCIDGLPYVSPPFTEVSGTVPDTAN
jgi:hypothetical protein